MQKNYSILTRRFSGIDVNVWLTLIVVIIVFSSVLIFKRTGDVPCRHFDLVATDVFGSQKDSLFVNEEVTFVAKTSGNVVWDFGDGATKEGTRVKHAFLTEGKQTVSATLNGKCDTTISLNINKVVSAVDVSLTDPIQGPATVTIGKPKTFFYDGKNKETAIMWYLENAPGSDVFYTERAKFNFTTPGPQSVVLQINNDPKKIFKKQIMVLPAPAHIDQPPPVAAKRPSSSAGKKDSVAVQPAKPAQEASNQNVKTSAYLSDDGFNNFFSNVALGQSNGQDVYKYLCDNTATPVTDNGNASTIVIVLNKLYSKKYKNVKVQISRGPNQCVTQLNFTFRKKGLF